MATAAFRCSTSLIFVYSFVFLSSLGLHFHPFEPFQNVNPRKLLSFGLTTFVLVALTFRNSFLSSHDVTDFITLLAANSLLTKMSLSSALCRFQHSADDSDIFVKSEMAADRVMKSVTSWLERKLFLKVSATKTKVVRPNDSNFLGFTFWKGSKGWKCKPANDRKAKLYAKIREVLQRKEAVSKPLSYTFTKVNQIVRGWINYFRIGSMKAFMKEFGEWLRHKIRVIIVKMWKKPKRIYTNLQRLNKKFRCSFTDEEVFKVANSRLGLYRQCGMNVINFIISPKVLGIQKAERPGLVNPLEYYLR